MTRPEIKRTLIIYNPHAGVSLTRPKARDVRDALARYTGRTDLIATQYAGHAKELAAASAEYDCVVCCGGDGTLNEVLCGLLSADLHPCVCYVPMGSTNDFAGNLGLGKGVDSAAELMARGEIHSCDIGMFNDDCFSYIASFGPGVSVSYSTPQKFKNILGHGAYMLNGFVFNFLPVLRSVKPRHIRVGYDGNVIEDDFYFGTVSNTLSSSGLFKFDENEVRLDDGLFEVTLIRRLKSPMQAFEMLTRMRRHDYSGDTFLHFQASELHFSFDEPEVWTFDGEPSENVKEVDIRVLKGALNVFCEKSGVFSK